MFLYCIRWISFPFIIHFINILLHILHSFIHILVLSKEMTTSSDSTTNLASAVETNLSLTDNDLSDLIKIQGDIVRKLKAEKASKAQVYYLIVN